MKSFLIVLGLTFSSITFSQILFGGYAGIGVGSTEPKDTIFFPQNPKMTYSFGVDAHVLLAEKWQLGAGLEFFNVGHNVDLLFALSGGEAYYGVARTNVNYLSVPVNFGFRMGSSFVITPKLSIIPGFMVGSFLRIKAPEEITLSNDKVDNKDQTNRFNLSASAGIEFAKITEKFEWFGSVEYRHSIGPVFTVNAFDPDPVRHFGGYLKFGLRYSFIPVDKN